MRPPRRYKESPSQTAGPYVHIGCTPNFVGVQGIYSADLGAGPDADLGRALQGADVPGERITIAGQICDGAGELITDAMVESWQADAQGRYPTAGASFSGWARQACDLTTGVFTFRTIKPGCIQTSGGPQSPHISIWIVARGINLGLHTRIYFADEDNSADSVLALIEPARRQTLIASQQGGAYVFNVRLQGENETVFFDL